MSTGRGDTPLPVPADQGAAELRSVAHALEVELKRVPGTRDIYTVGGPEPVVHVLLDSQRLAGYSISLDDLRNALQAANVSGDAGALVAGNHHAGHHLVCLLGMGLHAQLRYRVVPAAADQWPPEQ